MIPTVGTTAACHFVRNVVRKHKVTDITAVTILTKSALYVKIPSERLLLEMEDLLKFGLIPEFVGRLPVIATLEELDEAALIKILDEPKNALTRQYARLFEMEGVGLEFRSDALRAIARKALERRTGARGLRSILENVLLDTMYEIPSKSGVSKVVIDESVIEGGSNPLMLYEANEAVGKVAKSD